MADETDAFIQEIDDELRQEKAEQIWKQYGNYIVGAVIAVVASVGGYQAWQAYDRNTRFEQGEQFAAAQVLLADGKTQEALSAFRVIAADSAAGYALLARFNEAALHIENGDLQTALTTFREIAADDSVSSHYRDIAVLVGASRELELSDGSDVLLKRAADLASGAGPWRHSAAEIVALDALRSGDKGTAREMFEKIVADTTAPRGIQQRAREMLTIAGQ